MEGIKIFKSGKAGPIILIVGLVHGNEIVGKYILDKVEKIAKNKLFLGTIITLVGNPVAFRQSKRFIDMDLNRSFGEMGNFNYEQKRASEIKKYFIDNKIKVDYIFDFHSTPTKSEEMIICTNNPKSIKLSQYFPINKVVLGLTEIIEGLSLTKYFSLSGAIDFAFECGQHGSTDNIILVDDIIDIIIKLQKGDNLKINNFSEKIFINDIIKTSNKNFHFLQNFKGFEIIKKGLDFAFDGKKNISLSEDKIIVIPRIDAIKELEFRGEVIVGYLGKSV